MKKLLFLLITLCTSLSMAQSFIITRDGFVNKHTNQDFVVIESKGKSQKGLFDAVKSGISKISQYSEIKKIEEEENSKLSVIAIYKKSLSSNKLFRYRMNFEFKEGAVKLQIIYLDITKGNRVKYFKRDNYTTYTKRDSFLIDDSGKVTCCREFLEDLSDDIILETKRAIKQAW
jgi:hypothetical protein